MIMCYWRLHILTYEINTLLLYTNTWSLISYDDHSNSCTILIYWLSDESVCNVIRKSLLKWSIPCKNIWIMNDYAILNITYTHLWYQHFEYYIQIHDLLSHIMIIQIALLSSFIDHLMEVCVTLLGNPY